MPELPEVETIRRGIETHLLNRQIKKIIIRNSRLRWDVPKEISKIEQQTIQAVRRRGKYLILQAKTGSVIIHLGMSGCLRLLPDNSPVNKHDHIDFIIDNDQCLRFTDPRRFGACLWTIHEAEEHPLLAKLGKEPLHEDFTAAYLFQMAHQKKRVIKQVIMDSHVVVGVGNIYAAEALFIAGIQPTLPANQITFERYEKLVSAIKHVLVSAIKQGGTTLRDFVSHEGKPGYFKQQLNVYGRAQQPCYRCGKKLINVTIQNRSTVYCPCCQK